MTGPEGDKLHPLACNKLFEGVLALFDTCTPFFCPLLSLFALF